MDVSVIRFNVSADAAVDQDVLTGGQRELIVDTEAGAVIKVGDAEPQRSQGSDTFLFPGDTTDFGKVRIEKGKEFFIGVCNVDDDGNHQAGGPTRVGPFTATDSFAPQASSGVNVTGEAEEVVTVAEQ